jgi:hypothetical protein
MLSADELYSRRRQLARLVEKLDPNLLDIYGYGWRGEPIGWIHRLIPHRPYAAGRGPAIGCKSDYLGKYRFAISFENVRSNVGYISEKIFDLLFANTVPIYLGDEQITQAVPQDCFVDARKFRNDRELLEFARDCPEVEWQRLCQAGQTFIHSPAFEQFRAPAVARTMRAAFQYVTATMPAQAMAK